MFLVLFLTISPIFSMQNGDEFTTFCICKSDAEFNCTAKCGNNPIFEFASISQIISNYSKKSITFLIMGTSQESDAMPIINIAEFTNRSVQVIVKGAENCENIFLKEGQVGKNTSFVFSNLNIHFEKGSHFIFESLQLIQTSFTPNENYEARWKQTFLNSDFFSLVQLTKATQHGGSKNGSIINCDKDVNHIQFLENLAISFFKVNDESPSCTLDLSQVGHKHNTTILINTHHLKLTFSPLPKDQTEIPKIVFSMNSNSNVFIDSEQFDDDNMNVEKITFLHKSKTLYINSRNGTIPPTFSYIGSGYTFVNDRKRAFYTNYCICKSQDCSSKCGSDYQIINSTALQSIETTIVGNPNGILTYYIADTTDTEGLYPVFNIEHFEDKRLTLIGDSLNEHVGFVGDGTDATGQFFISSLTIHTQHGEDSFLFPNVTFRNVKVYQLKGKPETQPSENAISFHKIFTLRSYHLNIDYVTLKRFTNNNVIIEPPEQGIEIDAHLNSSISLSVFRPHQIEFNHLINLSLDLSTIFVLHTSCTLKFYISPTFPDVVTSFPKLRIYLDAPKNHLYFPQQWSSQLTDISAQVTIVHGDKEVRVHGDYDSEANAYKTKPPIMDHEGNGPFYFNDHLSNYKSLYCICEGSNCPQLCFITDNRSHGHRPQRKRLWPPINFSEDSIAKTVIDNPTRHIEYFIHGSTPENRPLFGLHSFQSKSFSIIGCPDDPAVTNPHQYVSLEGSSGLNEMVSTSVSHAFSNVNILFATSGVYFFNNVVFTNCQIIKNPDILKQPNSVFKIIQSGMAIDMPTLNSFGTNKSDEMSLPTYSYLRVNGDDDLSKIVIDDEFHLNLFNSNESLKGCVDVSLLKTNHAELRTNCGETQDNPIIIEWNPNNGIKAVLNIPRFIVDVSNIYGDDAYITFRGRRWNGNFRNLTAHIKIRCGPINLHIISEKVIDSKGRSKKVIPPFVAFEGEGDIYIDEEKQISSKVYGNGIMNLAGSVDYEDDLVHLVTPIKLFFIMIFSCAALFVIFIVGIKIKRCITEHERYSRIVSNLSSMQETGPNAGMKDLHVEQFRSI